MPDTPAYYHDPDGRKMAARQRKITELMGGALPAQRHLDRRFWEIVHDHEHAPTTTDYDQLLAAGFELPAPERLDDEQLAARLAALLEELARMHVDVMGLDDLSPRAVYTRLVERSLREEHPDVPLREGEGWTIDVTHGDDPHDPIGPNDPDDPDDLDDPDDPDELTEEDLRRLDEIPTDG